MTFQVVYFYIGRPYKHLVDWKDLQANFPWSILLLIGGGKCYIETSIKFFERKMFFPAKGLVMASGNLEIF